MRISRVFRGFSRVLWGFIGFLIGISRFFRTAFSKDFRTFSPCKPIGFQRFRGPRI